MSALPTLTMALLLIWASYSLAAWLLVRRFNREAAADAPSTVSGVVLGVLTIGMYLYGAASPTASRYIQAISDDRTFNIIWVACNVVVVAILWIRVADHLDEAADAALVISGGVAALAGVSMLLRLVTGRVNPPFDALPILRQQFFLFRIVLFMIVSICVVTVAVARHDRVQVALTAMKILALTFIAFVVGMVSLKLAADTFYLKSNRAFIEDIRLTTVVVVMAAIGILGASDTGMQQFVPKLFRHIVLANVAILVLQHSLWSFIGSITNLSLTDAGTLGTAVISAVVTAVATVLAERHLKRAPN